MTENTSRSNAQEIDTRFSRGCTNTNLDEDADHDRTGTPVVIGQPIGSSTTFVDVDIDFRIPWEDKMITDRRFLFRPPISVKITGIFQKTPEFREMAIMIFLSELILAFWRKTEDRRE